MNKFYLFLQDIFPSFLLSFENILLEFSIVLLKVFIIFLIGFYSAKILYKKLIRLIGKKDEILGHFVAQAAYTSIFIITFITMLTNLGVHIGSILTILGAAGVAIALALRDSLSSIAGGIILIILRPFKKNDTIEVGVISGNVESINLFNTMIRMPDDKLAILPNRNIVNANIVNCTDSDKRRIEWIFGVQYDSDIEKVREVLKDVIAKMDKLDSNIAPFVGVTDFGQNCLNFTIRVWARLEDNIFTLKSELIENTKNALDKAGVEIPPQKINLKILDSKSKMKSLESKIFEDKKSV